MIFSYLVAAPAPACSGIISPELASLLETVQPGGELAVIVRMKGGVNDGELKARVAGLGRQERPRAVVREMQEKAERSGRHIRAELSDRERIGGVRNIVPLWIANGLAMTAVPADIRELAARDDVAEIVPDRVIPLASPVPVPITAAVAGWNLTRIGAPTLWNQGFRGQGVLVAGLDTGVDLGHPALKGKWRGGSNSWFDPYKSTTVPYDLDGHGTATMGVMVAGDTVDNPVGVAPAALWIAAKVFDDTGNATQSAVHRAFQWLLDPDGNPATDDVPDVVNNSWDLDNTGVYQNLFQADINALRAAGIVTVFAGGNVDPATAGTSVSPANNPGVISVGATDIFDAIASFSARGPTAATPADFAAAGLPYDPIYPVLVAPGVHIKSTILGGAYATFANSGTSFSAPHVAGAVALLLSGRPAALARNVGALEAALKNAAQDLGSVGPDNTYGYGLLDAANAVTQLALQPPPTPSGDVNADSLVNLADVLIVLRAAVGIVPPTFVVVQNGDVYPFINSAPVPDGIITVADALILLKRSVGQISW